jgi:hypothetical protein
LVLRAKWPLIRLLLAAALLALPLWAAEEDVFLSNAMNYLRGQQQKDGSFGHPQPRLRTGLAMLALLSLETEPPEADVGMLERAADYLLKAGSSGGDLGDDEFRTESHAVALTALVCAHECLRDPKLRSEAEERIERAVRHLLRIQDQSSSSPSRGGWKMEGGKGQTNDRRATGWAMLACKTAQLYGLEVPDAHIERGMHFMLGAFKERADNPDQVGGFSVDTLGLAVELAGSMGGWVLSRFGGKEEFRKKNLDWLARHPPGWTGPNYFYSAFFRVRTLKFEDRDGKLYRETRQRLAAQIADHQQPDGSVSFPPGNAQNTVLMGGVFSTAMSVLIVNADDSRLPYDEDYRLRPRF